MRVRFVLVIGFVVLVAGPVLAQQGAVEPVADEVPVVAPPARVVAGQDGFAIESGNGYYRLQFGLVAQRSEEHTSELQSQSKLVYRLLLVKKKKKKMRPGTEVCHM